MVIIERRPAVVTSPLRRKKHMFQIGGRYRCAKHPTNLRSVPGRPGNGTRPPSESKRRGNVRPRRYPTPSPLRSTGPPIRRPIWPWHPRPQIPPTPPVVFTRACRSPESQGKPGFPDTRLVFRAYPGAKTCLGQTQNRVGVLPAHPLYWGDGSYRQAPPRLGGPLRPGATSVIVVGQHHFGHDSKSGRVPLPGRPGTDRRLVGCFAQPYLTPF